MPQLVMVRRLYKAYEEAERIRALKNKIGQIIPESYREPQPDPEPCPICKTMMRVGLVRCRGIKFTKEGLIRKVCPKCRDPKGSAHRAMKCYRCDTIFDYEQDIRGKKLTFVMRK